MEKDNARLPRRYKRCGIKGCEHIFDPENGDMSFQIPKISSGKSHETKLRNLRRKLWSLLLKNPAAKDPRICRLHFISGEPADVLNTNNPDWIPTLKVPRTDFKSIIAENVGSVQLELHVEDALSNVSGSSEHKNHETYEPFLDHNYSTSSPDYSAYDNPVFNDRDHNYSIRKNNYLGSIKRASETHEDLNNQQPKEIVQLRRLLLEKDAQIKALQDALRSVDRKNKKFRNELIKTKLFLKNCQVSAIPFDKSLRSSDENMRCLEQSAVKRIIRVFPDSPNEK